MFKLLHGIYNRLFIFILNYLKLNNSFYDKNILYLIMNNNLNKLLLIKLHINNDSLIIYIIIFLVIHSFKIIFLL